MSNRMTCPVLSVHTTSVCTLKCACCAAGFQYFDHPVLADVEQTVHAFKTMFQVYDFITEVRLGGAEAFLYPGIETLMTALTDYKDQFEYAMIATNGTYIPKQSILDTIKSLSYPMIIRVDHYGEVSKKYDELLEVLRANGIKVDERIYHGEDQAFGGWVDYGDYSYMGYSDEELRQVFDHCRMPAGGPVLFNGRLSGCCHALSGFLLNKVPMLEGEYVDLLSEGDIAEMRSTILGWLKDPVEACKYCKGMDPVNAPRIPAGIQMEKPRL